MDNIISMEDVIKQSFEQYSGAVLQSRALIDARDCVKPSTRQIYYALATDGFIHSKPYQKTLKAIGSTTRFYIHGDSSVEGILMRSAQPFSMRYPLVEVEGSYGTQMSTENWAAPRYTASRLSPLSQYLIGDTNKHTIDEWVDNYDDTEQYPRVLSSLGFYNIVNGSMGIGVGLASSIPQFNLKEVNDAMIKLLRNPTISDDEIVCYPDWATGCTLINAKVALESLKAGKGKAAIVRATMHYDKKDNCIVVTELPYSVYSNTICEELEKMVSKDPNCGIINVNDLTGSTVNIKIYLDKGINPDVIMNKLYAETSLQKSISINLTMLENGRFPRVFTWREALTAHLEHEKHTYINYYNYELEKKEKRLNIVNGLLLAIAQIDKVVRIVRSSTSTEEASSALQTQIGLNEEQAKAVLDIKLSRLVKLEASKLEQEKIDLEKAIAEIKEILNSDDKLKEVMIKRFNEVSEKFGDERRTKLDNITITKEDKEAVAIVPDKVVVTLTKSGMIKRTSIASFKTKRKKIAKSDDDIVIDTIRTNTVDSLMIFTNKGVMYRLSVNDISDGDKPTSVHSLIKMASDEYPEVIYSIYKDTDAKYVLFVTKNGLVKKTALDEFITTKRKTGIAAINLREGDSLASVSLIKEEPLILVTKNGMVIKFASTEIATTGRATAGVKGIDLKKDDYVVTGLPLRNVTDNLALFTSEGYGKQMEQSELVTQKRAGVGVVGYKATESSGYVVGAALITTGDNLLLVKNVKSVCVKSEDIPILKRIAAGNLLAKGGIQSVSKI